MQTISSFRFFFTLFLLSVIFGCATSTSMKMPPADLQNLGPNEGIVVGSLIVKGGRDLLGRKKWELIAKNLNDSNKTFSITANRDQGEEVFVSKMPAGNYSFSNFVQPGTLFRSETYLPFTVHSNKLVYIGRIIFEFPPGFIHLGTKLHINVEDAKEDVMGKASNQYGLSLNNVETELIPSPT